MLYEKPFFKVANMARIYFFMYIIGFIHVKQILCQEAEIHAEKTNIMQDKDDISIICRPKLNGAGFSSIFGIQLKRNLESNGQIVSASIGSNSVIWHDETMKARAVASFNLTSVSSANLKVLIKKHDVTCGDGSHYICEITGQYDDFTNGIKQAGIDITIRVDPDSIDDISVCPTTKGRSGIYPVGANITLMCRSTVGYPARNILWCLKRSTDRSFSPVSLGDPRFYQDDPLVIGCQSERKGFLKYTVANADNETIFMCTASESVSPTGCLKDTPKSFFVLHKKSTDSEISVCNSLVSKGKVKREMNIEGIDVRKRESSDAPIYSIGSRLTLSCTGFTSGSMSKFKIHWCIKRSFDADFYEYPFSSNVVNGDVKSAGVCRYKKTSTLHYNVTMADTETRFMCQLGVTDMMTGCRQGRVSKTSYVRLYQIKTTTEQASETTKQINPTTKYATEHVNSRTEKIHFCSILLLLLTSLVGLLTFL